jgi:hypothetical protein
MNIDPTHLDVGEVELIQWQFDSSMGSFKHHLWKTIAAADSSNMKALSAAFPLQVQAYTNYCNQDGYWMDVLTRAGLVKPRPDGVNDGEAH